MEGKVSIASDTLGKLHTKPFLDLAMYLSIGKAFRNLAIEILDYLTFPYCFLNLFDHRILGEEQGTPSHILLFVVFLWNSVLDMLLQIIILSLKYMSGDLTQKRVLGTL